MARIGLFIDKTIKKYPKEPPFHPSVNYSEYPFKGNLSDFNPCYDAVRNCLHLMKLDENNYGTEKWNPLSEFIKPGYKVVIKPNLVFHSYEPQDKKRVACTITHGSIIRAVLDYVIIALKGNGSIIIADAPIEGADFRAIVEYTELEEIVEFARKNADIKIAYYDVRIKKTIKDKAGIRQGFETLTGDPLDTIEIDLGNISQFSELDSAKQNYLTMGDWTVDHNNPYDSTRGITNSYHYPGHHKYKIGKTYLSADAIVSIGKMKTHKKAGVTLSLKNFIGLCPGKEYLPHHRGGPPPGGDSFPCYPKKVKLGVKKFFTLLKNNSLLRGFISAFLKPIVYKFGNPYVFGPIEHGSWSGNNTLWRTILDLNLIARYADKRGEISKGLKRKFFFLIDGIIAGEGEGPMQNKAKPIGLIAASDSSVKLDSFLAKSMGFNPEKIPHIKKAEIMEEFSLNSLESPKDFIFSNVSGSENLNFKFRPARGWKSTKLKHFVKGKLLLKE